MVGTKITLQKGWMDGELYGWNKNNSPKRWMKGKSINSPNRYILDIKLKLVKTYLEK